MTGRGALMIGLLAAMAAGTAGAGAWQRTTGVIAGKRRTRARRSRR